MSERNRKERQLVRYGQCLNEDCEKCKKKEIQQIPMRKEFVCEECGKPLFEVQPQRSWFDKNRKAIITAIVAVVIIGGGIAWFSNSGDAPIPQTKTVTDSVAANQIDTTKTAEQVEETAASEQRQSAEDVTPTQPEQKTATNATESKPKTETASSNSARLKCGKYEGPMSGGKPNGIGGSITVTSSYTIDLKDGNGGKVTLEAGDRISNTKFKNGVLQQGQLIRSNGERKFLSGLSERL
jgi:hypothetical protein